MVVGVCWGAEINTPRGQVQKEKMIMRYYETLYLIKPDLSEDEYKDVLSKFTQLIEKNKGIIIKTEEWGKKTLAYAVKKFDKGFYVLLNFCGEPDVLNELSNSFGLDERILKYQTIKLKDNVNPEELIKKEREDKGEPSETVVTEEEVSSEKEGEDGV
jgi:small subunit ribosomal protein S6